MTNQHDHLTTLPITSEIKAWRSMVRKNAIAQDNYYEMLQKFTTVQNLWRQREQLGALVPQDLLQKLDEINTQLTELNKNTILHPQYLTLTDIGKITLKDSNPMDHLLNNGKVGDLAYTVIELITEPNVTEDLAIKTNEKLSFIVINDQYYIVPNLDFLLSSHSTAEK